jgi:hypothetical protein
MPTRPYNDVAGRRRARRLPTSRAGGEVFTEAAKLAGDVLALRLAKGLTQRQLVGIDQGDLSRIERGQANPTMATFREARRRPECRPADRGPRVRRRLTEPGQRGVRCRFPAVPDLAGR